LAKEYGSNSLSKGKQGGGLGPRTSSGPQRSGLVNIGWRHRRNRICGAVAVYLVFRRDAVSDLRLEKAEGLFGHNKSDGAGWPPDASTPHSTGADRLASMEAFYKNLSIVGGFLLLYITGAGKYSIDALCGIAAP